MKQSQNSVGDWQEKAEFKDPRFNEFLRNKPKIEVIDYQREIGEKQSNFKDRL